MDNKDDFFYTRVLQHISNVFIQGNKKNDLNNAFSNTDKI